MEGKTNVSAIDDKATIWQVNWVEVAWPVGPELCTKQGDRLWFQSALKDVTGSKTNVWMNEQSALALSGCSDKDKFIQVFGSGEQTFPIISSVKIERSLAKLDGESQSDRMTRFVIVEAKEQPLEEKPTQATVNLLNFMPDAPIDTSCFLPSPLHAVQDSDCYAFQVKCPGSTGQGESWLPCQKVVALVKSTQQSKPLKISEEGFKLVTENVRCVLASDDEHLAARHTLSSICSLDNLPQCRLDPVRNRPQYAMVTITAKVEETFIVDQVQLLDKEAADHAKIAMEKLMFLAMHIHGREKKREMVWSETFSPVAAKKCRVLGRSATDIDVEPPIMS